MPRTLTCLGFVALLVGSAVGQSTRPTFQIADVHASASTRNAIMQGGVLRAGRYELQRATMLDLIKTAYGVDADTVFGGPSWLEWDRFDVVAKAPPATSPDTVKLMLQSLLTDRFKLVLHKDTKPIDGFVLSVGKVKHKLKEADGAADAGCQERPRPPSPDAIPPRLVACHNMTMEALAPVLRELDRGALTGPVMDKTGITGAWDFEITWNDRRSQVAQAGAGGITIFDALDRQLGLKLEPGKVPMPVLVVDRVNEKPTGNPTEVTTLLPPRPPPEFEVASIRPVAPGAPPGRRLIQPGGRVEMRGLPLFLLIMQAWDLNIAPDEDVPGRPKWLKPFEPAFDLVAKAPAATVSSAAEIPDDDFNPMLRTLLADRFKMAAHYEDRPMDAYSLVGAKPKLKRSDISNGMAARAGCKTERAPVEGPPKTVATCRNTTMAQFAEQLQTFAPNYLRYPVLNASGIEGAWDFTFTFSSSPPNVLAASGGQGGPRGGGATPGADPVGGISLFDALQKQLGLKLQVHKRPEPVFVIDHIEERPTDN